MNWKFWKKKPEPIEPPKEPEKEPEKEPDIDDWEPKHGDWCERTVCHCGQNKIGYRTEYKIGPAQHYDPARQYGSWGMLPPPLASYRTMEAFEHTVCPKCGHRDKWEKIVGRWEWTESPSRKKYWDKFEYGRPFELWRTPEKWVKWTEDSCPVKEEK